VDALAERPFLLYAALLLVTILLPSARSRALAGAGLLLTALGIAADRVGGADAGSAFAITNEILGGAGALIVIFAAFRAWRERAAPDAPVPRPPRLIRDPLLPAGLLLAAFGPQLILVAAGTFLGLLFAAATAMRTGHTRWTALAAIGAVLLGAGFFLQFTILGPLGGRMSELSAGPFSPPAERLLVILLGFGALLLSGLFPFHRAPWRLALAPVAAILLVRVLVPALAEGLRDWQAPAMLWLTVAVAFAAFQGRWSAATAGGGLLGMWSGNREAVELGLVLVSFAWLADAGFLPPPLRSGAGNERWSGLWFAVPAAAIPFVLSGALQAQVLVSVLAVAVAVTGLVLESHRRADAG